MWIWNRCIMQSTRCPRTLKIWSMNTVSARCWPDSVNIWRTKTESLTITPSVLPPISPTLLPAPRKCRQRPSVPMQLLQKMQLLHLRRHLRKRHKHSRFLLTTIQIRFTITLSALSRPGKNSVIACKIWKLRKSSTLMMMICSLPILTWTRCRLTSSLGLLTTPRCLLAAWRRLWAAVLMQCCPLCAARKAQGLPLKSANVLFRLAFQLSMA